MSKPITVAYNDYIDQIVKASNEAGLPSFLKIIVLEKVIQELRPIADAEYQRDLAAAQAEE
jgi:hypothetical protein